MSFWQKIQSLFSEGLFPETRQRNKILKESKGNRLQGLPYKGCYLKPGPKYQVAYKELMEGKSYPPFATGNNSIFSNVQVRKKAIGLVYLPKLNPVDGSIELAAYDALDVKSQKECGDFWMVTDLVLDETGQFKFQFIGSTGMGWTKWMDIDEFSNTFEKMSRDG